jgi:hypothetical protein
VYPVKVGLLGPKELFARKLFAQSYYHFSFKDKGSNS